MTTITAPINRIRFGFIAIIFFVTGFIGLSLLPPLFDNQKTELKDTCLLGTVDCRFSSGTVSLSDDTVKPLIASKVDVMLNRSPLPDALYIVLEGVEMNMGSYVLELPTNATGSYSAEILLPLCSSS